jgi:hypothetical protein
VAKNFLCHNPNPSDYFKEQNADLHAPAGVTIIPQLNEYFNRAIRVFGYRSAVSAAALALSACAGAPLVTAAPSSGATLLPPEWKQGVAGAELPEGNTVGDWIAFGDAQTGKLDQANERTKAAIGIVERCEARDAAAIKRATRGFFGRLFG